MNRKEFKCAIAPYNLPLRFSVADSLGTKLHPAYLDVFLPTEMLPAFHAACEKIGVRAVSVSVLPYSGSHRRVCL